MKPVILLSVLVGILSLPHAAFAYLDPGTGSYFLQFLVAGVLGALFAIKTFWTRIRLFSSNLFKRFRSDRSEDV